MFFISLGDTSLHYACRYGSIQLVRMLMENGADPTIVSKADDQTPVNSADSYGHVDILDCILWKLFLSFFLSKLFLSFFLSTTSFKNPPLSLLVFVLSHTYVKYAMCIHIFFLNSFLSTGIPRQFIQKGISIFLIWKFIYLSWVYYHSYFFTNFTQCNISNY